MQRSRNRIPVTSGLISVVTACLLLSVLVLASIQAQAESKCPVPRVEEEFFSLGPYVNSCCGRIRGDDKGFTFLAFSYGPLDLQVTKARSPQEVVTLKNFYFGFVAQAAGIDPVQKANEFHGGPPLAQRRLKLLGKDQ
jgi:hypothetical protein